MAETQWVGEHQLHGPQSTSVRQLPGTQWLPSLSVYGDPRHAHVWPVGHALSPAHVSVLQKHPPQVLSQRPFTPPSAHCESFEHMGPPPPLHVPLGAGPRHCESFGRWFTGSSMQPLEEPLPERLLDAPQEDPLPEPLLDPPEAPLDDPLPLLEAPLEESLPPELLPLEPVLSAPASLRTAAAWPPHAQRAATARSRQRARRMAPLLLRLL